MAENEKEATASGPEIKVVPALDHKDEVKALFTEYTDMLVKGDAAFRKYMEIQHYDEELEHLEKKYGPPGGRLYLAYCGGRAAGCIGLRRIDADRCELKRLYVRPEFRGFRLGGLLVNRIIEEARGEGYKRMLLDTLPFLESAQHIYKKSGFREVPPYNDSPMSDSIFMELDLERENGNERDGIYAAPYREGQKQRRRKILYRS